MSVHEHSIDAFIDERNRGRIGKRMQEIIGFVAGLSPEGSVTDRLVMKGLGYTDPNKVRPSITELISRGVLEECGSVYDAETHKTVRLIRLKRPGVKKKPDPQLGLFP